MSAADTKPDGGPAFPVTEAHGCNSGMPGLSTRDYFVAHAPTIPRPDLKQVREHLVGRETPEYKPYFENDKKAGMAYHIDLMRFNLQLDAQLRLMWAEAMVEARGVVEADEKENSPTLTRPRSVRAQAFIIAVRDTTLFGFEHPAGSIGESREGIAVPDDWVLAIGQKLRCEDYPDLFAVIGHIYSPKDIEPGYFGLPDCRGRFL